MATGRPRWRIAAGMTVASLATILTLAAACSANSEGSGNSAPQGGGRADSANGFTAADGDKTQAEGAPPVVAAPSGAPADPNQAPNKVEPQQRSVIYTGSMSVRVDDVNAAADRAVSLATGLGGFVGADRRTLNDKLSEANITLRVPAAKFDAALAELAKL